MGWAARKEGDVRLRGLALRLFESDAPDSVMDVAERRFAWLLRQRGYSFWSEDQLEKKITVCQTRPDFYVETPRSGAFLVEVESFVKPGPLARARRGAISLDAEPIFARIRLAVKHATDQLRPYKTLHVPMLVVLDNWRRVGIPSNIVDLRNALFGTLEVRVPVGPAGPERRRARWHHGKGQRLNDRQGRFISAVAWNLPKRRAVDDPMIEERPMYVRMVHNPYALVPFPIEIFSNGDDEHYGYRAGRWVNFI